MIARFDALPAHVRLSCLMPVVVVLLAVILAAALPERHRQLLALAALIDATLTTAALVWTRTPRAERHARVLPGLMVRGVLVTVLAFPELLRGWWLPALTLAALTWRAGIGLRTPVPAKYVELDDVERHHAWLNRLSRGWTPLRMVAYDHLLYAHLFRRPSLPRGRHFGTQRGSAAGGMIGGLVFLTVMEALPLHVLLDQHEPRLAWAMTGLHALSVLWLLAQARALNNRPVTVGERRVYLRSGMIWTCSVPLLQITGAQPFMRGRDSDAVCIAVGNAPNVTLSLDAPIRLLGPYLTERHARRVSLHVDDPEAFLAALHSAR